MQIVSFINNLIPTLEECIGCIRFGSIIQDRSNLDSFELTEENKCCTNVFVEGFRIANGYEVQSLAGMQRRFRKHCDYTFNLLFLESSSAELQYHNETQFHEVSESRWENYIQAKLDCLGCYEFNPCDVLDTSYEVIKWNVIPEHNVSANFFDGVRVEVIIRKYG